MYSGKTWNNTRGGLIHFILDCFYEMMKRPWKVNTQVKLHIFNYIILQECD